MAVEIGLSTLAKTPAQLFVAGTPYKSVEERLTVELRETIRSYPMNFRELSGGLVDVYGPLGARKGVPVSDAQDTLERLPIRDSTTDIVPAGVIKEQEIDLGREAMWIRNQMIAVTPIREGRLRNSYVFSVGGRMLPAPPANGTFSVISIVNYVEYASYIWLKYKIYNTIWKIVKERADKKDYRVSLQYEKGAIVYTNRIARKGNIGGVGQMALAAPRITIGYPGALTKVGKLTKAGRNSSARGSK